MSLAYAAAITPAAAALSFTLTATQVTHTFSPEAIITFPGDPPSQLHFPPAAADEVQIDTTGVSFVTGAATPFEIILAAPAGHLFTVDPGLDAWQFGFGFTFSDEALNAVFDNLTVMFLDVSSGNAPDVATGMQWDGGRLPTAGIGGRAVDILSGAFAFTALRVAGDFTPPSSGTVTLDSAVFSFGTRDLAVDADPGPALTIQPIPEPVLPMIAPLAVFLVSIRRRPPV